MPIQSINPANEILIGEYQPHTEEQIQTILEQSMQAFLGLRRKGAAPQPEILESVGKLAEILEQHSRSYGELITAEMGKPINQAVAEVEKCAVLCRFYAENSADMLGSRIIPTESKDSFVRYDPLGPILAIMPWNFPFFLIARKMAPALVTGNTVVIKPSEETPLNAYAFAKLLAETDLPAGVFNLVGGRGEITGNALCAHPDVRLITFTGSVATGSRIMATAAKNLTRVNLELGGKAPAIVLADADLDVREVILPDGEATLVVPALEAARVTPMPGAFTIVPWGETDDPIAVIAGLLGDRRAVAVGDQMWARFLVEMLARVPDLRPVRAVDVIGELRILKDDAEVGGKKKNLKK